MDRERFWERCFVSALAGTAQQSSVYDVFSATIKRARKIADEAVEVRAELERREAAELEGKLRDQARGLAKEAVDGLKAPTPLSAGGALRYEPEDYKKAGAPTPSSEPGETEEQLTGSEVSAARILSTVLMWFGAPYGREEGDSAELAMLHDVANVLVSHGFLDEERDVTPHSEALLRRAKAEASDPASASEPGKTEGQLSASEIALAKILDVVIKWNRVERAPGEWRLPSHAIMTAFSEWLTRESVVRDAAPSRGDAVALLDRARKAGVIQ